MTFSRYQRVTSVSEENLYIALNNLRAQEAKLAADASRQRQARGRR